MEDKSDTVNEKGIEDRYRVRTPLGDVTNQVNRKRPFSSSPSTQSNSVTTKKQCCSESDSFVAYMNRRAEQLFDQMVNAGQHSKGSDDTTGLSPLKEKGIEDRSRVRTPLGDDTNQVNRKRPFSSSPSTQSNSVTTQKQCCSASDSFTAYMNRRAQQLFDEMVNSGQRSKGSDDTTGLSPLKEKGIEDRSRVRTPLGDDTNQVIPKQPFQSLPSTPSKLVTTQKQCSENDPFEAYINKRAKELVDKKFNAGQLSKGSDDTTGLSPLKGGKTYRLHSPLASTNTGLVSTDRVGVDIAPSGSALDRIDLGDGVDQDDKNCSEVVGSKVVESQSFSLKRCSGLNDGGCSNLSGDVESLKSCSCTFCMKVAYIWSDLHYKDVKDRVSVSMKSQREASDLAQRYILETEMNRLSQRITEPDLTSQWKSLFLHMENVFGTETNLLQADLQALRGIRDDYKSNLEMVNSLPVDVHPCSSDSSEHVII